MNEVWHARSGIVTRGRASADVPGCAVRPRMAVPVICILVAWTRWPLSPHRNAQRRRLLRITE